MSTGGVTIGAAGTTTAAGATEIIGATETIGVIGTAGATTITDVGMIMTATIDATAITIIIIETKTEAR